MDESVKDTTPETVKYDNIDICVILIFEHKKIYQLYNFLFKKKDLCPAIFL